MILWLDNLLFSIFIEFMSLDSAMSWSFGIALSVGTLFVFIISYFLFNLALLQMYKDEK